MPLWSLVGLSMVAGALIVLMGAVFVSHLLPRQRLASLQAPTAIGAQEIPGVQKEPLIPPNERSAPAVALERRDRPAATTQRTDNIATTEAAGNSTETTTVDSDDVNAGAPAAAVPELAPPGSIDTPRDATDTSRPRDDGAARTGKHRSARYSIAPPPGFRLERTGRRTTWRGPNGAQLLVETTSASGASPRADWERLDAALARKYGSHYRSLGIHETTLAGKPAAVWEFELDSAHGTTRKIDVAVHHRGTGYAVLGSAPAKDFDSLRPQLESAINSFQLDDTAATSSRADTRSSTAVRTRHRRHHRRPHAAPSDTPQNVFKAPPSDQPTDDGY